MKKTTDATVHTTCFGVSGGAWNVRLRLLDETVQVGIALSSMALHGVFYRLGGGLRSEKYRGASILKVCFVVGGHV
jgi:hypothetical protein